MCSGEFLSNFDEFEYVVKQVMENLESHGIYDFNFQTWKVTSVV